MGEHYVSGYGIVMGEHYVSMLMEHYEWLVMGEHYVWSWNSNG